MTAPDLIAATGYASGERPMIETEALVKSYALGSERVTVLKGVSLSIAQGEMVALTGTSGSGKSTLMNILGCLDVADSGTYRIAGEPVETADADRLAAIRNRHIGFVFQSFNLLPRLSALDNVALPLVYASEKNPLPLAEAALVQVGLADRQHHLPSQLSGGQRQRVAIARAMVVNPTLILADEPTGNLDSQTTDDVMALFTELHDQGRTLLIVTHEPEIAGYCQRVLRMRDGQLLGDEV
jgi:putative ABC transport system ATP-binding protein